MIEAICWDVGGVFSARPVDAITRIADEHELDPDAVFAAVFGPYHLDVEAAISIGMHGMVVGSEPAPAVDELKDLVRQLG